MTLLKRWAVVPCVAFGLLALLLACGGRPVQKPLATTSAPSSVPSFQVLHVSRPPADIDVHCDILVSATTTPDQRRSIAEQVIAEQQAVGPFSMLEVSFYDVRELYGYGGPALGGALYVSGKRQFEKPGNYAAMHLQTDFPNKDLSQRPSEGEVKVYVAWIREAILMRNRLSGPMLFDESLVSSKIAARLGLTVEQVRAVVKKVKLWVGWTPGSWAFVSLEPTQPQPWTPGPLPPTRYLLAPPQ